MISMHSRLLMCNVNKQEKLTPPHPTPKKKHNKTLSSLQQNAAVRGKALQRVLQWWTFPPVSCLTLLISHSKKSGNTKVCSAAWGEDDWWLVVMMFGILPTRNLLARRGCWGAAVHSTGYCRRKKKKNLGISKVLLHCHTVEPVQNAVICNVPGRLHSGCIGFMIMVHVPWQISYHSTAKQGQLLEFPTMNGWIPFVFQRDIPWIVCGLLS